LEFLPNLEIRRAGRFKNNRAKENYIITRFLMRRLISQISGAPMRKIIFGKNKFGKPFLRYPRFKNFNFNISHSDAWLVIVFSDECSVGVDIEKIEPIDIEVAKQFFSAAEWQYFYEKKASRPEVFYKTWTLKESFIKLAGKGMFYSLKKLSFDFRRENNIRLIIGDKAANHYFRFYNLDKKYQMAVCLDANKFPAKINILNLNREIIRAKN